MTSSLPSGFLLMKVTYPPPWPQELLLVFQDWGQVSCSQEASLSVCVGPLRAPPSRPSRLPGSWAPILQLSANVPAQGLNPLVVRGAGLSQAWSSSMST